jgi:DNA-binding NtrC family response regulator
MSYPLLLDPESLDDAIGSPTEFIARGLPGALDDEDLAAGSSERLLITAATGQDVQSVAARIHAASAHGATPCVLMRAADFPLDVQALRATCAWLVQSAAGGTVLVTDVENLPAAVQDRLIDLLAEFERARAPLPPARLVSGTTVSLFERVLGGTFSERLFYRLNVLHIVR